MTKVKSYAHAMLIKSQTLFKPCQRAVWLQLSGAFALEVISGEGGVHCIQLKSPVALTTSIPTEFSGKIEIFHSQPCFRESTSREITCNINIL